ncbi:hypothetical protein Tco_1217723 [Tanacetum coccineum]
MKTHYSSIGSWFKERLDEVSSQHHLTESRSDLFYKGWLFQHDIFLTQEVPTETSDGLAAIQAQLNNLGREIKKVNEKVYAAQVGCEQCKRTHYTKDFPQKEEGKTLEEAYYTNEDAAIRNQGASIKTLEI